MVVGGYAVAFHGFARFTKDIDVFFLNSKENVVLIRKCLADFGFSHDKIPKKLFTEKGNIIQFGMIPVRVDLVNEIDGVSFDEAEKSIVRGKYGKIAVNFIGKTDLIKNKMASGRPQDELDAKTLKKVKK
jgi:hypothetical protein